MEPRRNRLHILLALGVLLFPFLLFSQTSVISGIVNIYTPVLSSGPCLNLITVQNSAGFAPGDTVLIIQMQGATIDQTNTSAFGTVTAYNGAGSYEKAVIQSIAGNSIYLYHNLVNTYNFAGSVQMVSVPVYQDANVNGTLTCAPWDGAKGGVVVIEVRGQLTVTVGEINVSSKGFLGGALKETCPNSCNFSQNNADYFYADPNYRSAMKGTGIAKIATGLELGRGAQANGGGGGNDHNAGGGGGGCIVSGGIGSRNNEPGGFNCKGFNPGEAGKALSPLSGARIFMGGGGGAGHGNNSGLNGCNTGGGSTAGSAGGGIIIVTANTLHAGATAFRANATFAGTANGDGAGGGGAGGSVFLDVNTITANAFVIEARGGAGGSTSGFGQNRCYGPGGGGAGGAVYYKGAGLPGNVSTTLTGGSPGTILSSSNACNNTNGTALAGTTGLVVSSVPGVPMGTTLAVAPCILPVEYLAFTATPSNGNAVRLDWITATELDNQRFDIERSTDAGTFSLIGAVPSAAPQGEGATYKFYDRQPSVGTNWYRLRQWDRNGQNSVSEIREVYFAPSGMSLVRLFPNPTEAGRGATMELTMPTASVAEVQIFNLMGQSVLSMPLDLDAGLNSIQIPTQNLGKGIYFVRVMAQGGGEVLAKMQVQ